MPVDALFPLVGNAQVAVRSRGMQSGPLAGRWILQSAEIGVSVRSPYDVRSLGVADNLRATSVGGVTSATFGSMPMSKEPTQVSVSAHWRAAHANDDIRPVADQLRRLWTHVPRLNRRPLVQFRWAHVVLDEAWVTQARIVYVDGLYDTGLPRAFTASITVSEARPKVLERTTRFEGSTRYRRIGTGETFETLAWEEYRDPDAGIALRRWNTHLSMYGESTGDVVRLPDRSHSVLRQSLDPVSPALRGDVFRYLQTFADERISRRGPGLAALETELELA